MQPITINPVYIEIGAPALAFGLLLGVLITWLVARRKRQQLELQIKGQEILESERNAALEAANAQLVQAFSDVSTKTMQSNSESFLQLAEQKLNVHNEKAKAELTEREKAVEALVKPIRDALDASKKQIGELEKSRSEAYGSIRAQLESMHNSQKTLRQETQNLVNALRRPEVRGRWGEITLRRLVELAGMVEHCDFQEQASVQTDNGQQRPDMIVRMPDKREIIVDAKTPLDAYLSAVEAVNDEERKTRLQQHARNVRARIRELSSKSYWQQFRHSPDFVVLFIPGDQFLSAALDVDHTLIEDALSQNVILATPTSFVALLRAIAYGWRQEVLAENAEVIREVGQDLYSRLATFAEHLSRLGRSLDSSVSAYNKAISSYDSRILPGAKKFTELGVTARKEPPPLEPIERSARHVEAPEAIPASNDQSPEKH